MKQIIKQIFRGCGDLPHVGEHPGTFILFVFIILGGMAGAKSGGTILSYLAGGLIMAIIFVPMYLYGSYSRAQLSDEIENKEKSIVHLS